MTRRRVISELPPDEGSDFGRSFDPVRDYDRLSFQLRQRLENQPLIDVYLHGPLADKYGEHHRLVVANPREAVAALSANYPGFLVDFVKSENYQIVVDGEYRGGGLAALSPVAKEIHFIPQIEGGAFLFVPLVTWAAAGMGIAISATTASIIGGVLAIGLMVGLSLLLKPKQPKPDEETTESFSFTGPENVVGQGVAVPLIYGRVMAGSVVVSVGIETTNIVSNELRSSQVIRIVDAISEGMINQIVGDQSGIFLDGVRYYPGQYPDAFFAYNQGYRDQPLLPGQTYIERENVVNTELKYGLPIIRTIIDPEVDAVRFTVSTPALYNIDTRSGDYDPFTTVFVVQVPDYSYTYVLSGKTTSRFQAQIVLNLPPGGAPWTIVAARGLPDDTHPDHADETYWDSFTELYNDRVNYNSTAVVGSRFSAESFSDVPKRTYDVEGLVILVPSNYDALAGTYNGTWDGSFKVSWTNCPAWIFYDLVTNNRYGLGSFVPPAMVDKFFLYKVAQWCDVLVSNGKGDWERRFTCNIQIRDQQEAFDLLNDIAGCFRGFSYWAGGMLRAIADMPDAPLMIFTNADVIDGQFAYQGSDIRGHHTQVATTWQDQNLLGEVRVAVTDDHAKLTVFGIQRLDLEGIGITSEAQAIRNSKWALYTEQYEDETLSFSAGLKSAFLEPGQIIQVSDSNIAGDRFGGRVGTGSTTTIVQFDSPVPIQAGHTYYVSCVIGDNAHIETRRTPTFTADVDAPAVVVVEPFGEAPRPDTVFVVSDIGDIQPTLWRVAQVSQTEADKYDINATRHLVGKWAYVEQGIALTEPDITDIIQRYPAVTNLKAVEYLVALSPISVGVRVILSWTSEAPAFDVSWRESGGNWLERRRVNTTATDFPVEEGWWDFRVIPMSAIGLEGEAAFLSSAIIGRFLPPQAPKQFRIKISDGVALFEWLPATELDVVIGGHFELRHSAATIDATWVGAQTVIPSIPGSATSVETVYRTGTWFLRTFDIVGLASPGTVAIIALEPDGRYEQFARICENPDFLGGRFYTEVLAPQQWLVLGTTGGLWDEQLDPMDTWPAVDVLPGGAVPPQSEARHGWYIFNQRIDAGGVFPVRFASDILAFPYAEGSEFIDDRLIDIDDWADFDNVTEDLAGQVVLFIRTTDNDPALSGAAWSEWEIFAPVEYTARGFEFRADLYAPAGQNIGIETLCIVADLKEKFDDGADVLYSAVETRVYFNVKFFLVPAVVITVQLAMAEDRVEVLHKTREYFDLKITMTSSGTNPVGARTFDWHAQGY